MKDQYGLWRLKLAVVLVALFLVVYVITLKKDNPRHASAESVPEVVKAHPDPNYVRPTATRVIDLRSSVTTTRTTSEEETKWNKLGFSLEKGSPMVSPVSK